MPRPLIASLVVFFAFTHNAHAVTLSGQVLHASGELVTDATLEYSLIAIGKTKPATGTVSADSEGRYKITGLDHGTINLIVFIKGRPLAESLRFLKPEETDITGFDIKVPRIYVLRGYVLDDRQELVPDAHVTLLRHVNKALKPRRVPITTVTTNADGVFDIPDVTEGTYDFQMTHKNYAFTEALALPLNMAVPPPQICIHDGLTLSGIIVDEASNPIKGAHVTCKSMQFYNENVMGWELHEPYRAEPDEYDTGDDGTFILTRLSLDSYHTLITTHPAYPSQERTDIKQNQLAARVVLKKGYTLFGQVTHKTTGAPIPNLDIHFTCRGSRWESLTTVTNSLGFYRMSGLTNPYGYEICFGTDKPFGCRWTQSWIPPKKGWISMKNFSVEPPYYVEPVQIDQTKFQGGDERANTVLEILVRNPDGSPAKNHKVYIGFDFFLDDRGTNTDLNGFVRRGYVTATEKGFIYIRKPESYAQVAESTYSITKNERKRIQIFLPRTAHVSGRIFAPTAGPESRFHISARVKTSGGQDWYAGGYPVSATGYYCLTDIHAGTATLYIWAKGYVKPRPFTLPVNEGQIVSDINFTTIPGGEISGTVLNATGSPINNAYVYVDLPDWEGYDFLCTNQDGLFHFTTIPDGTCALRLEDRKLKETIRNLRAGTEDLRIVLDGKPDR